MKIFIFALSIFSSYAKINEYVSIVDRSSYLMSELPKYTSYTPSEWNWGNINGTNYLTKNLK